MGGSVRYRQARAARNAAGDLIEGSNGEVALESTMRNVSKNTWNARKKVQQNARQNKGQMAEKMKDAKAMKEIQDSARRYRALWNQVTKGTYKGTLAEIIEKTDKEYLYLSKIANQVDSNVKLNKDGYAQLDEIEKVLGVKVQ